MTCAGSISDGWLNSRRMTSVAACENSEKFTPSALVVMPTGCAEPGSALNAAMPHPTTNRETERLVRYGRSEHDASDDHVVTNRAALKIRHLILLVLFLGYFIAYIDRVNISVAGPTIRKEPGLTPTELG